MSMVNLKYKCGHKQQVKFDGPWQSGIERAQLNADRSDCDQCRKKKGGSPVESYDQMPMLERLSRMNQSDSLGTMLPALRGTSGMVQWAEAIRSDALKQRANAVPAMLNEQQMAELTPEKQQAVIDRHARMVAAREELESNVSAEWWIQNKDTVYCYVHNARYRRG